MQKCFSRKVSRRYRYDWQAGILSTDYCDLYVWHVKATVTKFKSLLTTASSQHSPVKRISTAHSLGLHKCLCVWGMAEIIPWYWLPWRQAGTYLGWETAAKSMWYWDQAGLWETKNKKTYNIMSKVCLNTWKAGLWYSAQGI